MQQERASNWLASLIIVSCIDAQRQPHAVEATWVGMKRTLHTSDKSSKPENAVGFVEPGTGLIGEDHRRPDVSFRKDEATDGSTEGWERKDPARCRCPVLQERFMMFAWPVGNGHAAQLQCVEKLAREFPAVTA
ncbi:hypothetical protein XPA_003457 [Xanthoria parietina]